MGYLLKRRYDGAICQRVMPTRGVQLIDHYLGGIEQVTHHCHILRRASMVNPLGGARGLVRLCAVPPLAE